MKHTKVKDLLNSTTTLQEVNAKGWVRTFRNNQFIALNDGSTINNIQCVVDFENTPEETLKRITTGAAISVTGLLIESQGAGQKVEIQVTKLEILGDSDAEKFPIQPKNKPSLDFLAKIITAFPKVNASWLVTGEAREEVQQESAVKESPLSNIKEMSPVVKSDKSIEKIIVFYKDGLFDEYKPNA